MKIDLIMMSKFGSSDGGRETWFNNLLSELNGDKDDLEIILYSLNLKLNNVVEKHLYNDNLVEVNQIDLGVKKYIPLTLLFIIKLCFIIFKKNKRSSQVVAVGSLNEMLACFFSYPPILYKGKKIIWLRTVSRKEFGMKTKKFRYPLILIEYFLLKFYFDQVLTNGTDTGDFYESIGIKNLVINNGINNKKWYKKIENFSRNRIIVGYVGRLEENKGIVSFCEAIKLFNEKSNNIYFKIVGEGSCEEKVKRILKDNENVEFLGAISNDQVAEFLYNIDVSVALTFSNKEMGGGGLSNALLEQMCAGNLIIAWDNEIFRQILSEKNSILVKQASTKVLAERFNDISLNYDEMLYLREKSQKLSLQYSSNNNKNKFLEVLYGYK